MMIAGLPRVTVIIPCYNRERFIRETIDSALSQTYPNMDVVVIDDGISDGSRKILDDYGKQLRILEHPGKTNKGQSASINLAIQSTDSEYIAVLDSDDVWLHNKIEVQVEMLEKNKDIGLVYVNGYAIDCTGEKLYKLIEDNRVDAGNPEKILLEYYIGPPSSWLLRRSILEITGGFDESMRSAQDHDMAIRLAEVTKLAYIEEPLWYYRRHSDTQSWKHTKRRWKTGFKILKKARNRHRYHSHVFLKRLAVLNYRLGQCLVEERRYLSAAIRFLVAGMLDPLRATRVILGKERRTGLH
jgi:glycosyltransferase involved in cell wall biosynthesis